MTENPHDAWDPQEPLRQWTRKNHAATLARDRAAMGALAEEFDAYIGSCWVPGATLARRRRRI